MIRNVSVVINPFVRYCVIGAVVTLIDLGLVFFLKEWGHASILWATFWGFVVANSVSFLFNKYWTFHNYATVLLRQYFKFLIVSVFGLVLTIFLMWLFVERLQLFAGLTPQYYLLCKGLTSGVVVVWNFFSNKLWTFANAVRLQPRFDFSKTYAWQLTAVVPAYNEEHRIVNTVQAILNYFEASSIKGEVVVVDDGSGDATSEVCRHEFGTRDNFRLVSNPNNRGKGFAVNTGIQNAGGEYILVADADNSTPIEEFGKFAPLLAQQTILIGSRYVNPALVEIRQPWYRIAISRAANLLIQLFVVDGIKDTQCGFKAFHHSVAQVLSKMQRIHRFAFDIEFLCLAQLSGIDIQEIPVRWLNSSSSRVRPIRDTLRTFADLVRIKFYVWNREYSRSLKSINSCLAFGMREATT